MSISHDMTLCPIQDPFRFRARFLALEMASLLIDETGGLEMNRAHELLSLFEKHRFLIGPHLENDAFIFEHIRSTLKILIQSDPLQKLIQKFSPPVCHSGAERLIRATLWPKQVQQITAADLKRAVLAALFTHLRQTTGSCFATAPAILIQRKQPLQQLRDLFDLLTYGALHRVISGQEYTVPLCPSIEQFDVTRPLAPFTPAQLSMAPGLRAAFAEAGFPLTQTVLEAHIKQEPSATTPKELIEAILLHLLHLQKNDVAEEEGLRQIDMNQLFAKQSAIYYQKPSERSIKVSQWKKAVEKGISAYQALSDCALLRAWEATLASFSDVKLDVAKWNIYVSLGLHPDYVGGIGSFIYQKVQAKLDQLNQQITKLQGEYEHLLQIAHSAERRGLQGEYSHATMRASGLRQEIEEHVRNGEKVSHLARIFLEKTNALIPDTFQEIFDPSLAKNLAEMIDDSPAGFRLAHKHGRKASSQWTYIRSAEEFIRCVKEFFESAERELALENPEQRPFIEQISTDLIVYLQTDEFLNQSIERTRKNPAFHDPRATPWEYISGGTMPALLMAYTQRQFPYSALQKTIHNELELISFLSDAALQTKETALMYSPTHAFLFHPEWLPHHPHQVIGAMQNFWKQVKIEDEEWLAFALSHKLPEKESAIFLHRWRQYGKKGTLAHFRESALEILGRQKEALIDSFLYESLPLISSQEATHLAKSLGLDLSLESPWVTPIGFREWIKSAFISAQRSPFSTSDVDEQMAALLRQKGWAAPRPLLFADTNWSSWLFGLSISPSGKLDLWRFTRTAMSGVPMPEWFRLQCGGEWVILNRPNEYTETI